MRRQASGAFTLNWKKNLTIDINEDDTLASLDQQYYGLSHRLRGIFTTLEGIINLIKQEKQISDELYRLIVLQEQKGYREIESFGELLATRVREREGIYQQFYRMLTVLHDQMDELNSFIKGAFTDEQKIALVDRMQRDMVVELFVEELNMMANLVRRMVDFNRNIERRNPWE